MTRTRAPVVQCSDNQGSRLDPGDLVVIDPKYQASLLLNLAGAIYSSPCSFYNKRAFYPLLSSHIIFPPKHSDACKPSPQPWQS
jgi:hypothetical protein